MIIKQKMMIKVLLMLFAAMVLFRCTTPVKKVQTDSEVPRQEVEAGSELTGPEIEKDSDLDQQQAETDFGPDQQKLEAVFYPMPPQQPKLQFLVSITYEEGIGIRESPIGGTQLLQIKRPYDIGAVKGKIYISDLSYKKVLVIDLEKKELDYIEGDYESTGIWVTEDDYKYITDFRKKQILVFDNNNELIKLYAYRDQFDKPVDVAVFQNKVYVSDINKHHIIVLDKYSGKTVNVIGGIGIKEGKFYKPTHVIVDRQGNIYVNDFFNFRIQKFTADGAYLKTFGYPGDTLGAFARPKGLDVDKDGNLYVVDAAFENVQIFDNETTDLLIFFGGFGLDTGQMYMPGPVYIDYHNVEYFKKYANKDFDLKYLVYVGNTLGPIRMNVYGFGEWTGPSSEDGEDNVEEQLRP